MPDTIAKNGTCKSIKADLCIVGGGLAGTIAALAAARNGVKVALMQDRPVLGGNSSSEIRMYIRGAVRKEDRETGILNELEEENIYRNAELSNSLWDGVLWGKVINEPNITLLLNCSCLDLKKKDNKIISVTGWQLNTYTWIEVFADYFADCSGDSILAPLSGAMFTCGRESKKTYNENFAPDEADTQTMGMSCLLQAREIDRKVDFIPPEWANVYLTDEDIGGISKDGSVRADRCDTIGTNGNNLWWMEVGSNIDGIEDTEDCYIKLMKVVYGVWDHIKNRGEHGADNYELEWVGVIPGKRESRRYIGDYVLKEKDILSDSHFDDVVAYGGWPLDSHDPKGIETKHSCSLNVDLDEIYGIPYRCLYSKNIDNLLFAGRNISASHVAFSSTRVLGTCSVIGQAMGTAVAICKRHNVMPRQGLQFIREIQNTLMNDGIYLPSVKRKISEVTINSHINISDKQKSILFNGIERPRYDGKINYIELDENSDLVFEFDKATNINVLRIVFDLDYSRLSISKHLKLQRFSLRMNKGADFEPVKVANTIVKEFSVFADDERIYSNDNNYSSLLKISVNKKVKNIKIHFQKTHGYDKIRLFACDFI